MATVERSTSSKLVHVSEATPPVLPRTLYDDWAESLGIPIYRGYYVDDAKTLPLGWWEERQCFGAIVQLVGQEGVTGSQVLEIPPGKTTAPYRMAIDEGMYVVDGRGLTTVWAEGKPKKTLEWSDGSMFLIPRNHYYQLASTQGDKPARLMQFSYLRFLIPIAGDVDLFFKSPHVDLKLLYEESEGAYYSEAKAVTSVEAGGPRMAWLWSGNFFPDLTSWENLKDYSWRGAGGKNVAFKFPGSPIKAHMSVFASESYKKGHRHNAGATIIVVKGEGYSILWPEQGKEMVLIPWHKGTIVVPPHLWWHQHFNIGGQPARYLAFRPPPGMPGGGGPMGNPERARDQIEYPDEDPIMRQRFDEELAKRGLKSLMPEEAYRDKDHQFMLI